MGLLMGLASGNLVRYLFGRFGMGGWVGLRFPCGAYMQAQIDTAAFLSVWLNCIIMISEFTPMQGVVKCLLWPLFPAVLELVGSHHVQCALVRYMNLRVTEPGGYMSSSADLGFLCRFSYSTSQRQANPEMYLDNKLYVDKTAKQPSLPMNHNTYNARH